LLQTRASKKSTDFSPRKKKDPLNFSTATGERLKEGRTSKKKPTSFSARGQEKEGLRKKKKVFPSIVIKLASGQRFPLLKKRGEVCSYSSCCDEIDPEREEKAYDLFLLYLQRGGKSRLSFPSRTP